MAGGRGGSGGQQRQDTGTPFNAGPQYGRGGEAVTVQLSPPAHQVRRQAGLGLPNAGQILEGTGGVLLGAAAAAALISLSRTNRWLPALMTGSLGLLGAVTSPIGTFISEASMGMAATATGWIIFDLTHSFGSSPNPSAGQAVFWERGGRRGQ